MTTSETHKEVPQIENPSNNLSTNLIYPLAMVVFLGDAGSGKITLYWFTRY